MKLSRLPIGSTATILSVGGSGALRQHFLDMGLIQGTEVTVVKYAPMGDPIELRIHGYELTIRLEDAENIEISEPHQPVDVQKKSQKTEKHHPGYGEGGKFHNRKEENPLPEGETLTFALVGNQNCGKTTLFNQLPGEAIRSLSMEGRMTVCNMSIECGARGGMIAPDRTTFDYLRGRERAPQGAAFDQAVARWEALYSDADAVFDKEYRFDAADIAPMITYGTNPGMGMAVDAQIPAEADPKALEYMGFKAGEKLLGKPVDYVFVGSCTNGRIEDLRRFAKLVEGRRKAQDVTAWIVPGSKGVEAAARAEGLDKVLAAAGFELRQPGCSACLAMNADKIPAGKYSVSTSNRNFEGRQGPGARTMLAGIAVAAAAAVCGRIEDPRKVFEM